MRVGQQLGVTSLFCEGLLNTLFFFSFSFAWILSRNSFQVCSSIRNDLGYTPAQVPIIMLSAREPVADSVVQGLIK